MCLDPRMSNGWQVHWQVASEAQMDLRPIVLAQVCALPPLPVKVQVRAGFAGHREPGSADSSQHRVSEHRFEDASEALASEPIQAWNGAREGPERVDLSGHDPEVKATRR